MADTPTDALDEEAITFLAELEDALRVVRRLTASAAERGRPYVDDMIEAREGLEAAVTAERERLPSPQTPQTSTL